MEKKVLKLRDIVQVEAELNGFVNPQTGEKVFQGILAQKLPLSTKYWLTEFSKKAKQEADSINAFREELIKKYGKEENGMIQIERVIKNEEGNDILNPVMLQYEKEFGELLEQEKEIEIKKIKLDDIGNIETSETYPVLFTLLDTE